jgi:transposase
MQNKLYHMGIRSPVSKSTSVDANEKSDWRIYADFAQVLINTARDLYVDHDFGVELDETVYALDASTIDLCLSLFPWTRFRKTKGAIKLHTLLDLRGSIPTFISITDGKVHDVNVLDELIPEPGSFYIMDRGNLDFERLYLFNQCMAFFVIRSNENTKFRRLYSRQVDKSTGLRCDQTIVLNGINTVDQYPEKLRRVKFFDCIKEKRFSFLINSFIVPAFVVADLSKQQIWSVYVMLTSVEDAFRCLKSELGLRPNHHSKACRIEGHIFISVLAYHLLNYIQYYMQKSGLNHRWSTI